MDEYKATIPAPPSPDRGVPPAQEPNGDPSRGPQQDPWHDPGEPTRKINLPTDPAPAIIIPPPDNPMIS